MQGSIKGISFKPFNPGVKKVPGGYAFAFDAGVDPEPETIKEKGLILYDKALRPMRIPFTEEGRSGSLYGVIVPEDAVKNHTYNFYLGADICHDPRARALTGFSAFGHLTPQESIRCVIPEQSFDWEDDCAPGIPYEDSIFYGLNVRAFTMHKSSRVTKKGTFEGVAEKLPYLKELGVTALVLMPCYEFDECLSARAEKKPRNLEEAKGAADDRLTKKVNCWGFTAGSYFAPKSTYAAGDDPTVSFKLLIREAHKAGLEVMMQFYFPPEITQQTQLEALKFWVQEYHVDGFRVSGFCLPYRMLLNEPAFRRTKLWFDYIPYEELTEAKLSCTFRVPAVNNGNLRNDMRRFLKGDEGLLNEYIRCQRANPERCGVVNFICDYDGFTLADLYSYERKHNEPNGEDNKDGTDVNYSWNCGTEGPTRKKAINLLREREVKNALALLMLSAGTPYLFSGDEFLNSRSGNNNAYCQDNETGYVEWKDTVFSREILSFTKELIALRKNHTILHPARELRGLDQNGSGYPDISYHGFEAWRPDLSFISRMVGMFLYGPYAGDQKAASFYIGVNMHWENHRLALPKLKSGYFYEKILDTGDGRGTAKENEIPIDGRCIVVYQVRMRSGKK